MKRFRSTFLRLLAASWLLMALGQLRAEDPEPLFPPTIFIEAFSGLSSINPISVKDSFKSIGVFAAASATTVLKETQPDYSSASYGGVDVGWRPFPQFELCLRGSYLETPSQRYHIEADTVFFGTINTTLDFDSSLAFFELAPGARGLLAWKGAEFSGSFFAGPCWLKGWLAEKSTDISGNLGGEGWAGELDLGFKYRFRAGFSLGFGLGYRNAFFPTLFAAGDFSKDGPKKGAAIKDAFRRDINVDLSGWKSELRLGWAF